MKVNRLETGMRSSSWVAGMRLNRLEGGKGLSRVGADMNRLEGRQEIV